MHHPTDRITHTTAFVTPVVEHWLERELTQWVQHMQFTRLWSCFFLELSHPSKQEETTLTDFKLFLVNRVVNM